MTYLCAIPSPTECCGVFLSREVGGYRENDCVHSAMGVDGVGKGCGGGLSRQGLILDGFGDGWKWLCSGLAIEVVG